MADPRLYQIGTLAALLAYGMCRLDFQITVAGAVLLLGTVLAVQAVGDRLTNPQPAAGRLKANLKSALISGLSLCLLLRTSRPGLGVLAGIVTIGAK